MFLDFQCKNLVDNAIPLFLMRLLQKIKIQEGLKVRFSNNYGVFSGNFMMLN
ncbi:MAG: hypothetical protein IKQ46_12485 [Bacteroidales bacterium]|nr:hypothetical protein [Bacteroidales bacterium]